MLKQDIISTYNKLGGNKFQRILGCARTPGLYAVMNYRFGHWLLSRPRIIRWVLRPFYLIHNHWIRAKWGIEISCEATIGEGFLILHYGGVFVGSTVKMGKNCSVSHNVTIGLSGTGKRRGAPVVGNNVYFAPGANASGRITIGDNARIGANAVVDKDVPANALVQVRPMQVVTFPSFYGNRQAAAPEGE